MGEESRGLRSSPGRAVGPLRAPRSRPRIGAFLRSAGLLVAATGGFAGAALAQDPPDSLQVVPPDTALVDTLGIGTPPDSLEADTVFYNLPRLQGEAPDGWETGVWSWDHTGIMASAANTLGELVAEVPGLIVLVAGDYGTPSALSAFGSGGGGVRIFRDGFEVPPLGGGVADLSRIGLGGIGYVRLERSMGALRIEMSSIDFGDARPYSLVEAGTGELDTNIFRGMYADPTALGGSLALALERVDTQGPGGRESGNRTGSWVRYQLHRGDDAGIVVDFRRMGTQTELTQYASGVTRTDWSVGGKVRLAEGVVGHIYTGKSTHDVTDIRDAYATEGGSRTQHGLRVGLSRAGLWARGEYRLFGGDLPANRLDLAGGVDHDGVGGFAADLERGSWSGVSTSSQRVRAWTHPFLGISLFGSWESGTHGARTMPLLDIMDTLAVSDPADTTMTVEPEALFGITDRSATRLGARLNWHGATVSGALLKVEADSLIPLGIEPDRGSAFLFGGERTGWEVWGTLPTPMNGLRLEGSLQQWDEPSTYLPEQIYRGAFVFHRSYKESGNLELWWTLGVRGHDPMTVHIFGDDDLEGEPTLETVPFYQNWYGRIQVRIVTVRIFVAWENIAVRRNLQTFPGRVLPALRSVYGLRWTLWN